MIKDGWNIMGLWQSYHSLPHENQNVKKVKWGGIFDSNMEE